MDSEDEGEWQQLQEQWEIKKEQQGAGGRTATTGAASKRAR